MSKEGPSGGEELFLARPFVLATRLILAFPYTTLALVLGLSAAAAYLTATRLGYQTSRMDLLDPKSNYNQLWTEYIEEFGDDDDAVVVVEGAGRDQVVPVLEELSTALAREDRLFHAVLHEVDRDKIRSKGLHYLSPEELVGIEQFLAELGPMLAGNWSSLNVSHMATGLLRQLEAAGDNPQHVALVRGKLARLADSLGAVARPAQPLSVSLARDAQFVRDSQRAELRIPADQAGAARLRTVAAGARRRQLQSMHRGHRRALRD